MEHPMYATPTQFSEMQKSQIDALYALSHVAFNTTEKLVDLNLAAMKAALDESAAAAQSLLSIKDAQDMMAVGGSLTQPAFQKFVGYGRNVYNIVSSAGADVRRVVESQLADGNNKAAQLIEFATKNAPAGSEPVVSMFKNAVAAYNSAYETISKATRQALDAAESNFDAAAKAAATVVTAEPEATKSKGRKAE
jgi:phasin family protein